jgi:hypothetical protein
MPLDFTICTGTSGNGVLILGMIVTKGLPMMVRYGMKKIMVIVI